MVQQHMHLTFMYLSHALSTPVFYNSPLFSVCVLEIFLLELREGMLYGPIFTVNTLSFASWAMDILFLPG
jgi:hypothetical protein